MRNFRKLLPLIVFIAQALTGLAQNKGKLLLTLKNDDPPNQPLITWYAQPSKEKDLKVGDVVTLTITADINDAHWHLYSAQKPDKGIEYKPTEFILDKSGSKGVALAGGLKELNKPKEENDEIMGLVRYYVDHSVRFTQDIRITEALATLSGTIEFQVCVSPEFDQSGKCIPGEAPFSFSLSAAGASATGLNDTLPGNDSLPQDTGKKDTAHAATPHTAESGDPSEKNKGCKDENLWLLFIESFLLGFAAVLTPCVFPMIPLTVSFFTKQSGTRNKGIRNALLYGFFIILMYTGIGLIISAVFGPLALYEMSTNTWVNVGFFVLMFIFALSFLGMFEITLPSSWVNAMDQKSERGGIMGIFFMALTLALVSFSCTGPLVGTALVEAATGGCVWSPIISMLGFSSALAIPFCVFAVFPGWMNSLPKSGGWLNSVKVVLGFLELALGLKFLSQADLVMKWHLLDREVFIASWIVDFTLMGIYLLGKIQLPHDSPVEKLSVPRVILATIVFWFVLYLVPGMWGARLPFLSGILPPPNAEMGVKVIGQKQSNEGTINGEICQKSDRKYLAALHETQSHGFCTFFDLDEAIAFAQQKNLPVFVDFTGHSCSNCRQMEQKVWAEPEVSELLKTKFVMVSLFTDEKQELEQPETVNGKTVKTVGKKWLNYQIEHYKKYGQPYHLVIDFDRTNLQPPRAYNADVEAYVKWLNEASSEFAKRHPN